MNVEINLLSKNKKDSLKKMSSFIYIKNILSLFILLVSIISTMLIWSWLTLVNEFENLSQSALLIQKDYTSYNQETKEINDLIDEVKKISGDYKMMSPVIIKFANLTPKDIKLNVLKINIKNKSIYFSGVAETRDGLLNYEDIINNSDWLEPVEIPTSQLFKKENISFNFETKIKSL